MDLSHTWPVVPSVTICGDFSPYPLADLQLARTSLIRSLGARDSEFLERLKIKLGLISQLCDQDADALVTSVERDTQPELSHSAKDASIVSVNYEDHTEKKKSYSSTMGELPSARLYGESSIPNTKEASFGQDAQSGRTSDNGNRFANSSSPTEIQQRVFVKCQGGGVYKKAYQSQPRAGKKIATITQNELKKSTQERLLCEKVVNTEDELLKSEEEGLQIPSLLRETLKLTEGESKQPNDLQEPQVKELQKPEGMQTKGQLSSIKVILPQQSNEIKVVSKSSLVCDSGISTQTTKRKVGEDTASSAKRGKFTITFNIDIADSIEMSSAGASVQNVLSSEITEVSEKNAKRKHKHISTNRIVVNNAASKLNEIEQSLSSQKWDASHDSLPYSPVPQKVGSVLKCDLCEFYVESAVAMTKMNTHLMQYRHTSASFYRTVQEGNPSESQLTAVLAMKLCTNNLQWTGMAEFVVCPECFDVFLDIFACSVHFKYTHGGTAVNGCYTVIKPSFQEKIFIDVKSRAHCMKCQVNFGKEKLLNKHWKDQPDHLPLTKTPNSGEFMLFLCLYCDQLVYNNFIQYRAHVLQKHGKKSNPELLALNILYFEKPRESSLVQKLPAFGTDDCLKTEVHILHSIRKSVGQFLGGKRKGAVKKNLRHATAMLTYGR